MDCKDQVILITGASNGIGKQLAIECAERGATVAGCGRSIPRLKETLKEVRRASPASTMIGCDVSDAEQVHGMIGKVLEDYGKIDILINNAGILRDGQLLKVKEGQIVGQMSETDFDAVIGVNLKGVFNCTQAVAPGMIQQGYGRIVSASSVVGLYGNFGQTNYVATKAGVIGMNKVWARELGNRGITCNVIAPGFIATDMTKGMPEKILQSMIDHTPVGRLGQPSDIAYAYLFLASDEAGFINGAVLSVDGGVVTGT
jgi:3-oxoacyl-[acyl-carrier protein] reductase